MKPEERPTAEELARGPADGPGLCCRRCGCRDFRIRNTRMVGDVVRRYRVCRHCGQVRTTTEK